MLGMKKCVNIYLGVINQPHSLNENVETLGF